jgi:hypothetical protein
MPAQKLEEKIAKGKVDLNSIPKSKRAKLEADIRDWEIELDHAKHVMAVKLGENAFLVRLERFLLNREEEIRRLLREEGRP